MPRLEAPVAECRNYAARRIATLEEFLVLADAVGDVAFVTPFQAPTWLVSWYQAVGSFASNEPLLIAVEDMRDGRLAMLLPLVILRGALATRIEFADQCLTDYCFPLLGPAAPLSPEQAFAAWQSACACMPKSDLIRIAKMPDAAGGRVNPLGLLTVRSSSLVRNVVALPETWEAYLASRSGHFRKFLRQKMKSAMHYGEIDFAVVTDCGEACRILHFLAAMQRDRLHETGSGYVLDQPPFDAFYERLAAEGARNGTVVISTLRIGGEIAAAAMTLLHGKSATMIRLAHAGGERSRCSPGILLACETIKWLISRGIATFDFGVGKYDYKQRFGCEILPLSTLEQALTARGRLFLTLLHGKQRLEENARMRSLWSKGRRAIRAMRPGPANRAAYEHEGKS